MSDLEERRLSQFPKYRVRADGSVISEVHRQPRVLKPIRAGEYLGLSLADATGTIRRVYVHRLVAEAFYGPPPAGHEVRHLDGNRYNNAATNVCWGARSENARDKNRHGTSPTGERHPHARLTDAAVREMRQLHRNGASLPSLVARFGVSRMTCWRAATGRSWSHLVE
jgi:hypothetical protein